MKKIRYTFEDITKLIEEKKFTVSDKGCFIKAIKEEGEINSSLILWKIKEKGMYTLTGAEFIGNDFGKIINYKNNLLSEIYQYLKNNLS